MKVAIIGPGALGCLFAARLSKSGHQTKLVDYKPDRITRLNQTGITVETSEGAETTQVDVVPSVPQGIGLVIVLTKSYSLSDLQIPLDVPVLTLQNGLGNAETLCSAVGSASVLAGVTSEACTWLEEGRVRHTASGLTKVGSWTSCPAEPAVEALSKAGFRVEVTDAPGQSIWEKTAINAGINPLTALMNVPNGKLLELPQARQLLRDLVVEAVKAAATEGYRFEHSLIETAEEV